MKLHFVLLIFSCLWYLFIALAILIGLVNEATHCVANAFLFIVCISSVSNTCRSGPKVVNFFTCSTRLSTRFQLLIKTEILTNKEKKFSALNLSGVVFLMLINANICWHFNIDEQDKLMLS